MRRLVVSVLTMLAVPAGAAAQTAAIETKTLADTSAAMFSSPKDFIRRAAEKMPEEHFAFRPNPEVRTFAGVLGHIADGYALVCGMALGDKPPADIRQYEKSVTTRAQALEALNKAAAVCDRAHEELAGSRGAELTKFGPAERPRVTILFFNTSHAWEHYGNLVTYMRIKGIVPPSSEPRNPGA